MSNLSEINELGQPVGFAVPNWQPPPLPSRETMQGRFCRIEAINLDKHAEQLFQANSLDAEGRNWTYLAYGPFDTLDAYRQWLSECVSSNDPIYYAIVDQQTNQAVGVCSYLRIDRTHGVIEVGHLNFSPLLQGRTAATEAMYLMMKLAFELGYRRYEWKCHSMNAPSRRAAQRLGLSYEGVFRQSVIFKGRNRDTAWYAAIDKEWPELKSAFETWLSPDNFSPDGKQKQSLSSLTAGILKAQG